MLSWAHVLSKGFKLECVAFTFSPWELSSGFDSGFSRFHWSPWGLGWNRLLALAEESPSTAPC